MTFTVVSTFSGCGGSSLGYVRAGGKVLLANDFDENAVATYKANFPNTSVLFQDIKTLGVDKILEVTNLKVGELDIFDGSPPCQGFSTQGKRNFDDKRNSLFLEYCRILKGIKPKCFVMENVSGMIKGNMKFKFVEILTELKGCGYKVKAKLVNAKNFQVPQSRQRLIFIGVRGDLGIEPSFPLGSEKVITLREALKDCPEGKRLKPTGGLVSLIPKLKNGENAGKYHSKGNFFGTHRTRWDKPTNTIIKTVGSGLNMTVHPDLDESLSIEELKRIFTFPDDYIFLGKFEEQWARLGNCVPPNLMKAIASHIYQNILSKVHQ